MLEQKLCSDTSHPEWSDSLQHRRPVTKAERLSPRRRAGCHNERAAANVPPAPLSARVHTRADDTRVGMGVRAVCAGRSRAQLKISNLMRLLSPSEKAVHVKVHMIPSEATIVTLCQPMSVQLCAMCEDTQSAWCHPSATSERAHLAHITVTSAVSG